MISLFNNKTSKNELMTYNGEHILDSICLKAEITEELNGEYGLDCIFLITDRINKNAYEMIVEDSLIKIDDEYGEEYFRIAQVRKNKRDLEVYARHITISDILTLWCEDVRPTELNGNAAINWIFDKSIGEKWFNVSSNISNKGTAYYLNKNVYQALFDSENSFLDRWGGEVYRRGFNLSINAKVGEERGVTIRSRKNLLGFESETNINKLATRIYPKGYDGITIEEKYIDSPIINNYSKVFTIEYKFEDIRVNDEDYNEGFPTLKAAQEEMKRRVKNLYEVEKVDIINAEYRINFVELGKTEEYKNYSILEKTWIGDTIQVIEENLNIDINVRVIKRVYDCLRQERKNTELSNKDTKTKPPSINDIIKEIENLPSQDDTLQKAKDNASALINAGIKNSHVVIRQNELLIMDTKDVNTAVKVWRWNVGGLGYSSTGYYGEYGTAITNDGAIVADFITTGILNANLIKTGMLKSFNGLTWIDMENGYFNFADKVKYDGNKLEVIGDFKQIAPNGRNSIEISNNRIFIYDYFEQGRETPIGSISALRYPSITKPATSIIAEQYAPFVISAVGTDGDIYHMATFDKNKVLNTQQELEFWENVHFWERVSSRLSFSAPELYGGVLRDNKVYDNSLFVLNTNRGWGANKDFHVNGNLTVSGTINGVKALSERIQALENIELQKEGLI